MPEDDDSAEVTVVDEPLLDSGKNESFPDSDDPKPKGGMRMTSTRNPKVKNINETANTS